MKVSNSPIEKPTEELLSRKVGVILQIIGWLGEMDLSAREKSFLLNLIKNQCLSLAKKQEFHPLFPTDKPS